MLHAADALPSTHSQQQHMLPGSPSVLHSQQHSLLAVAPSYPAAPLPGFGGEPNESFSYNDAAAAHGSSPTGNPFARQLAGTDQHAAAVTETETAAATASSTGPAVLAGSQSIHSSTAKRGSISWVATSCIVPEGLPTAAAAEAGGGLACMEVVCRLLVLQDCCPAAASPGLVKALSKGELVVTSAVSSATILTTSS
jgi:hypothetical protein